MEKIKLLRRDTVTEGGIEYTYTLSASLDEGGDEYSSYSIDIGMIFNRGEIRNATAKAAFCDKDRANLFYEKLLKNLATPTDLSYVLEDEGAKI